MLTLCAADDALYVSRDVLPPAGSAAGSVPASPVAAAPDASSSSAAASIKLDYATHAISPLDIHRPGVQAKIRSTLEIDAVVGVVTLFSGPHLVAVVDKALAGSSQLFGHDVFCVKKVAIVPFNAEKAANMLREARRAKRANTTAEAAENEDETDDETDAAFLEQAARHHSPTSPSAPAGAAQAPSLLGALQQTLPSREKVGSMFEGFKTRAAAGIAAVGAAAVTASAQAASGMRNMQAAAAAAAAGGARKEPHLVFDASANSSNNNNAELGSAASVTSTTAQKNQPSQPPPGQEATVAAKAASYAQIKSAEVFSKLKGFSGGILGLTDTSAPPTAETMEARIIRELGAFLGAGNFYYSHTSDVTTPLQRQRSAAYLAKADQPIWDRADARFVWNAPHAADLFRRHAALDAWVTPLMQGFVGHMSGTVEGQQIDVHLVSRRCNRRAGLRYERRGVDEDGDVANFVETEQLVLLKAESVDHVVSFVQTRGSIPLYWSQKPTSLKPVPVLEKGELENTEAITMHFRDQINRYSSQICVSLVEQNGREAVLGKRYRDEVNRLAQVFADQMSFIEFDFHEHTKGLAYENLGTLIDMVRAEFERINYFWQANSEVLIQQEGVFRTNCMDCLDRTNVVQSLFGRHTIDLILFRTGTKQRPDKVNDSLKFDTGKLTHLKFKNLSLDTKFGEAFKKLWADNGDAISRAYSGTSALKGDFTRTGKRNITGLVNDATNSISRLYLNNFRDSFRQNVIDFWLGYRELERVFQIMPVAPPHAPGVAAASTASIPVAESTASIPAALGGTAE